MPNEAQELELSNDIALVMRARGWTCATAESCSAGLVGHIITMIPGASNYFQGGVIAYTNQSKQDLLNVRRETLESVGAVSAETAGEMARGARQVFNADVGIATTGIAGPGGATARKPVGLIYVAVSTPEREEIQELRLEGGRLENIAQTARAALQLAVRQGAVQADR